MGKNHEKEKGLECEGFLLESFEAGDWGNFIDKPQKNSTRFSIRGFYSGLTIKAILDTMIVGLTNFYEPVLLFNQIWVRMVNGGLSRVGLNQC